MWAVFGDQVYLLVAFERLYVCEILSSAGCTLVLQQRLPADYRYLAALELELEMVAVGDGFFKRDTGDSIENVDSKRRDSQLKHAVIRHKVRFADFEGRQRRPELGQCAVDASGIRMVGADENVEVFRCSGVAVKRHSVATDDHELRLGVEQRDEKVAKVDRELDHSLGLGTNRHGMAARV